MTRSTLLGSLRGMLELASDDELRVFHVIASRVMGGGRKQYGPLHLANDARNFRKEGADEMADYVWYVAIQAVLDGYPATSSASPNELTHAEGVAPFSSPSAGSADIPQSSSGADSHGDGNLSSEGGGQ
jgi:hypothetical protein